MLSVLIETRDDEALLAATLASLVPAAVEGLVLDVTVLDRGSSDGTLAVAEHAGCRVISAGDLEGAIRQARGEWLLLLEPGARPPHGWTGVAAAHVMAVASGLRSPAPARFRRARGESRGFWTGLLRTRRTALEEGLLLPRAQALGLAARRSSLEDIAKGLASSRLDAAMNLRPAGRRMAQSRGG